MKDLLLKCAENFREVSKYNYTFVLGDGKRITINLNMRCSADEFTHVMGLDHLKDIDGLQSNNVNRKRSFFQNILNEEIVMADIEKSVHINKPVSGTYNTQTNHEYTIKERIIALQDIEYILDNAYKGKFYKWNKSKSTKKLPDGRIQRSNITADYMLCIPGLFSDNKEQRIYVFMYRENKGDTSGDIKLRVHSAFPDCVDMTVNQKKYAILRECKYKKDDSENIKQLFLHRNYIPE